MGNAGEKENAPHNVRCASWERQLAAWVGVRNETSIISAGEKENAPHNVRCASWERQRAAGGDGGNRTRVRKRITKAFYERSFCFKIPAAPRPKAGWGFW